MKKFAKVMAVALVAVLAIALLAACGGLNIPDDPAECEKYLKDQGYSAVQLVEMGEGEALVTGLKATEKTYSSISVYYYADEAAATAAMESSEMKSAIEYAQQMADLMPNGKLDARQQGRMIIVEVSARV